MKQLLTYILILLIVLQPLSKIGIYIAFIINQQKIAQTLCVQKEIVNNCCQGRCYLKKQVQQAEKQEQKQIPELLKGKSELVYDSPIPQIEVKTVVYILQKTIILIYDACLYASSFTPNVFRPPESYLA